MTKFSKKEVALKEFKRKGNKCNLQFEVLDGGEILSKSTGVAVHDDLLVSLNKLVPFLSEAFYLGKDKHGKVRVTGFGLGKGSDGDGIVLKGTLKTLTGREQAINTEVITERVAEDIYGWGSNFLKAMEVAEKEVWDYYIGKKIGETESIKEGEEVI